MKKLMPTISLSLTAVLAACVLQVTSQSVAGADVDFEQQFSRHIQYELGASRVFRR